MKYTYTVDHEINVTKISGEIQLSLQKDLVGAALNDNQLILEFASILSEDDQAKIVTCIQNHEPISSVESLKQTILDAMGFGQSIIAEFGAENVMLELTTSQTLQIVQKYAGIIGLLQTGSLKTALMIIEATPPDALVSAARIKKYANKIRAYLGMPLT